MSNIAGSSVEIEQRTPAATSRGSGCSASDGDGARAEVRERAHVEHDAAAGELAHQPGVLDGADAVAQPVGAERLERAAHGRRAGDLARMRHRAEAAARAIANAGAYGSGGNSASSPPSPTPTTPRSR